MDENILCTLLAEVISVDQFQLWETEVHWISDEFDTPENNAIVADVIANYDTLAAAYLVNQQSLERAPINYKAIIRRRAKRLLEDGKPYESLLELKKNRRMKSWHESFTTRQQSVG